MMLLMSWVIHSMIHRLKGWELHFVKVSVSYIQQIRVWILKKTSHSDVILVIKIGDQNLCGDLMQHQGAKKKVSTKKSKNSQR